MNSELPMAPERMIGAACTLDAAELKQRLAAWRELGERAVQVEPILAGDRLSFAADEPIEPIARLAALESECCAFYTFTLRVDGPARQLEISAGGVALAGARHPSRSRPVPNWTSAFSSTSRTRRRPGAVVRHMPNTPFTRSMTLARSVMALLPARSCRSLHVPGRTT